MRSFPFFFTIVSAIAHTACVLCVFSCSEKDPLPTADEMIQGAWKREWIGLTQTYNFHSGACDAYSIIPGQPYQYYALAYSFRGDTLTMIDLAGREKYEAIVSFPTDTTAVLSWIGGVEYHLTRI